PARCPVPRCPVPRVMPRAPVPGGGAPGAPVPRCPRCPGASGSCPELCEVVGMAPFNHHIAEFGAVLRWLGPGEASSGSVGAQQWPGCPSSAKLWVWLPLTTTSQSSGWSSGGWGPTRRARPRRGEPPPGQRPTRPAPHLASAPLGPPAPPRSALAVAAELAVWGLLLEDPGRAQRVDLTDHGVGLVRGAGAAVQRQQVHRH